MLYLAGYLTTEDTALANNTRIRRHLRVPNAEVAELYRTDIVQRFTEAAGGAFSGKHVAVATETE